MSQEKIANFRSRLDVLKTKQQECAARKTVLDEEEKKLKKRLKDRGFKNLGELQQSVKAKKREAAELEEQIEQKLTEIETALEAENDD